MKELTGEHAFVHENMGAYLAGGLEAAERGRFDGHINTCPECFDAFSEARDADRALQRTLGELVPREAEGPGGRLEERLTAGVRAATTSWWGQPGRAGVRRAAYATAAAVALAATGVFANVVMRQEGRFNNPLTEALAADADGKDSDWGRRNQALTGLFVKDVKTPEATTVDPLNEAYAKASGNVRDQRAEVQKYYSYSVLSTGKDKQLGTGDYIDKYTKITAEAPSTTASAVRNLKVASLVTDARKLYEATQFKEAADLLRQATIIDPQDENAALFLRLTLDKMTARQFEDIMHRTGQDVMRQSVDSTEHLIPYADLMVYPDNWPEIARQPGQRNIVTSFNQTTASGGINGGSNSKGSWDVAMMPAVGASHEVDDKLGVADAQPGRQPGAPAQSVGNFFLAYNDDKKQDTAKDELGKLRPQVTDLTVKNGESERALSDANGQLRAAGKSIGELQKSGDVSGNNADEKGKFSFGAGVDTASGLVKTGSGTLALSGASSFTGGVSIAGGTLDAGSISGAGSLTQNGRGTTGLGVTTPGQIAGTLVTTADAPDAAVHDKNAHNMVDSLALDVAGDRASYGWDTRYDKSTFTPPGSGNLVPVAASRPAGAGTSPPPTTAAATSQPDAIQALKIIRNGTIEFEVRSFDDAYQHITEIARLERGYVSSTSSEKLANGHVRGTIVVRVPPERLDEFLISLRSLGDLKAQQIGAADVTKQYYDIESQLRGLTTMETRLLDLIKNGKGEVKDLIEAETKLGETRVSIERLKGEISYYNNLVSLATITITAYEKDIASPTAASEQENVNVNVETEEVEAKYAAARKIFDDAKGRIVESQLKNTDAEHVAAHIVADVPPAQADFVANQLKQLGLVASFNRDRRQTTTGGTGTPGVEVEKKDTRFTVELFNLANLLPRETTVLRVAVKDVEASYKSLLGLVKEPPTVPAVEVVPGAGAVGAGANGPTGASAPQLAGRVMASNLTGQLPEQMSADVRAEVRTENADALLAALRSSGEVLTSQLNTNQDNANTTAAKRGLQVTLVNMASVSPKEADSINIAVRDVDGAYRSALALIRKAAPLPEPVAGQVAGITLLPATAGRVISSGLNGQLPVQMSADIRAEIRADQAAEVLAALKAAGEVVSSNSAENADTTNVTRAKRGLMVHFVNVAAISPREVQELHGVAANVADSYRTLLAALQVMAGRGEVRIVGSSLSDTDPRTVNARLTFEAQKSAVDAVEKAFTAAGLEFPSRSVTRAADSVSALDTKVGYQITEIRSAETMEPKRTITVGVEVGDVGKAVRDLRTALSGLESGPGQKVQESDFTVSSDNRGNVIAQIRLDAYVSATPTVMAALGNLGLQKSYQESRNAQAPETKSFTKERVDLTLMSRAPIVQVDQGVGSSVRAALSSAAGALLYSVYLVVTGLLFVLPFVAIGWPVWAVMRRRKAKG